MDHSLSYCSFYFIYFTLYVILLIYIIITNVHYQCSKCVCISKVYLIYTNILYLHFTYKPKKNERERENLILYKMYKTKETHIQIIYKRVNSRRMNENVCMTEYGIILYTKRKQSTKKKLYGS